MSPRSLLFSSDEETSRILAQALRELELEVDHCPEIFAAVERITAATFEVIAADWADGLEARFLLTNARDLKTNSQACTVAVITSEEAASAARKAEVSVVIAKPASSDAAKYALLCSDEFLKHMRVWLPKVLAKQEQFRETQSELGNEGSHRRQGANHHCEIKPMILPDRVRFEPPSIQSIFESMLAQAARTERRFRHAHRRTMLSLLVVVGLGVGVYGLRQPLRAEALAAYLSEMPARVLVRVKESIGDVQNTGSNAITETIDAHDAINVEVPRRPGRSSSPVLLSGPPPMPALPAHFSIAEIAPNSPVAMPRLRIPASLREPVPSSSAEGIAPKVSSKGIGPLDAVVLSEQAAQQLLVSKVQPSYPEQALREGLKGSVVLQAWIGTDGRVESLKLIKGYMVLGHAAYQAVKQWRFRPYILNGQAVEAQTYLTIDFQLR